MDFKSKCRGLHDTQLNIAVKPSDSTSTDDAIKRIEACAEEIKTWMRINLLKLNEDKTELLVITSKEELSKKLNISINIGDSNSEFRPS